ncbi:hypothetical protein RRU01S_15_00700 [Agrobacterium rubi TR3 = NBRC 13261]|uniref:Uncharacterized protein n=1 Tax=Agrobacterium rubi TR3 = NBRC 13261 TaxID=1368415 RepID=A0A081CWU9_9HYPH|nr:hypothetical protein [Agrobacterium rubi]MBP1878112.1 hypothetical protein [Agrobacterium rubi]GAK71145.1 hypothetical protein RRU01S_15_00700 [Agrobacterium rubi TR3 = NBRC 13261]
MKLEETKGATNYVDISVSSELFEKASRGWPVKRFNGKYNCVEYLNSPSGLIILAHQNTRDRQVDGIHPAVLSESINSDRNIVEPLKSHSGNPFSNSPVEYNMHWMTRRSQGALIQKAFGRMIDQGDKEAYVIELSTSVQLAIYDAPFGLVIALSGSRTNDVAVILSAGEVDFMEEGVIRS